MGCGDAFRVAIIQQLLEFLVVLGPGYRWFQALVINADDDTLRFKDDVCKARGDMKSDVKTARFFRPGPLGQVDVYWNDNCHHRVVVRLQRIVQCYIELYTGQFDIT